MLLALLLLLVLVVSAAFGGMLSVTHSSARQGVLAVATDLSSCPRHFFNFEYLKMEYPRASPIHAQWKGAVGKMLVISLLRRASTLRGGNFQG
jgi:hypothetical protein